MLQKLLNFVSVYAVTYWIVIFCILPIGIKRDENHVTGNDMGAPAPFSMKKKFIVTGIVSFILVSIYFTLTYFGIIDWDAMAE